MNSTDEIGKARALAAGLAARTDIRGVRLLKSSAEIIRIPAGDMLIYDISSEASVEYEPGDGSFVVRGAYSLSIDSAPDSAPDSVAEGTKEDAPAEPVARVEFEHAALFVIDKGAENPPGTEELNAYAVTTGQLALYPYVREYVSDITGRLGLPPLTLGILRMSLPHAEDET